MGSGVATVQGSKSKVQGSRFAEAGFDTSPQPLSPIEAERGEIGVKNVQKKPVISPSFAFFRFP
jgi:hypothetical protein